MNLALAGCMVFQSQTRPSYSFMHTTFVTRILFITVCQSVQSLRLVGLFIFFAIGHKVLTNFHSLLLLEHSHVRQNYSWMLCLAFVVVWRLLFVVKTKSYGEDACLSHQQTSHKGRASTTTVI